MSTNNALNDITSTNLQGGTANQFVYQTAPSKTGFISVGANSVLQSNGSNVPSWATSIATAQIPYDTNTLTSTGGNLASVAMYNISGGTANKLPLQSAANTTGFITSANSSVLVQYAYTQNLPDGAVFAGAIVSTNSVSSNSATTTFGTSMTAGTAVQNGAAYDVIVNMAIVVASATTATITLGVASGATPTTNTAIPSFSTATTQIYNLTTIVPKGWYVLLNTTGTISISSITSQACPL